MSLPIERAYFPICELFLTVIISLEAIAYSSLPLIPAPALNTYPPNSLIALSESKES